MGDQLEADSVASDGSQGIAEMATSPRPTSNVLVVRGGSAPQGHFGPDRFEFIATSVQTAGRYSFLAVDVPVGSGPPPHEHRAADEWFYVLEGSPRFHVADRAVTLHEGDFVHIPMGTTHWFEVIDGPVRVLAGYVPGGEELAFV